MKYRFVSLGIVVAIGAIIAYRLLFGDISQHPLSPSTSHGIGLPTPAPTRSILLPTVSPITSPSVSSLTNSPLAQLSARPRPVSSVQLAVPFTIQAPDSDWSEPWAEGCEEAALLMVDAYLKGQHEATLPVAETKQAIEKMVDWQLTRFGSHKNLGVDALAVIARDYLNYQQVTVKHNIRLSDIRSTLRAGHPVIVPAAGRLLGNPYFKTPGPLYHVFVIIGFDGDQFIVNENGTRQGKSYRYSAAILENALHDWQEGIDITNTPKAYLILER
jgi:hypothetical protein